MNLETAQKFLSTERLATYLRASDNALDQALQLYSWNTNISSAFMVPVAHTEVALRNALNKQLTNHYRSPTWYLTNQDFLPKTQESIDKTLEKLGPTKTKKPGQVVANLTFGFWRSLLVSRYEDTLWTPALRKGFTKGTNRKQLACAATEINEFRNRIAHHEPIFETDLQGLLKQTILICTAIDPAIANWISKQHDIASQFQI